MGQARVQMGFGRLHGDRATRIINLEKIAQGFPAPCAIEVEAVEMNEFGIRPVTDSCRPKQTCRLARCEPREKAPQPSRKFRRSKRTRHTHDFGQCWRKKILAVGLPCRAIDIVSKPRTAFVP